jgi:hypothetical protein
MYRIVPEVDKEVMFKGKYVAPEAYGLGPDMATGKRGMIKKSAPVQKNVRQLQLAGK